MIFLLACETPPTPPSSSPSPAAPTVHSLADASIILRGREAEGLGSAMAGGDFDGDGLTDLAAGAREAGTVHVWLGPIGDEPDVSIVRGGDLGWSVATIGDLDGNGTVDFAAGAPKADSAFLFAGDGAELATFAGQGQAGIRVGPAGAGWLVGAWLEDGEAGTVYLLDGTAGLHTPDDALAVRTGEAAENWAGYGASAAGDVDGDGIFDLVVGADGNDRGGEDAGTAYVELGPIEGEASLAGADAILTGEGTDDFAAHAVHLGGDLDGDGRDELVVGGFGAGEGRRDGAVYVYRALPTSGTLAGIAGPETDSLFGYALACPGDTDGDGRSDLLVTARFDDRGGADAGAVWLLPGPVEDLAGATVFVGEAAFDDAGYAVGTSGDVDGDGRDDVLMGAMHNREGAGAVYVWTR